MFLISELNSVRAGESPTYAEVEHSVREEFKEFDSLSGFLGASSFLLMLSNM
jgi:hypothetical protein